MKTKSPIMIDCYKMKKPNTGLYSFCNHLVNALHREVTEKERLSVYAPRKAFPEFPGDILKRPVREVDKLYMKLPSHYKVWHSTYQLGTQYPTGKLARVLTIHDLNFLYERNGKGYDRGMAILQRNIDRYDRLVAISEFTRRDILARMNVRGKEIAVIHNGCEIYTGPIQPPTEAPVKPFLFSLGTMLAKKNFHVLPCLLHGNDYELIIAGNDSPYQEQVLQEARRWKVSDRVHLAGPVSEPVKHWYLQNCTAFLFPSIAEGFGLPVVEAMYYGKPVFISRHTSLPEVGGDAAIYFNREFDPEGMQKEFSDGMDHFGEEITPERVRLRALDFSWEKAAASYLGIYRSLM